MSVDFSALAAEFPRDAISWRCQTVSKNGEKGLALAYIDARDVMHRLDAVAGPGGWQDRYEVHGTKTICYLSVRVGDEWITKADGAGDTDVEAEKGSLSDAFKRSAVKWGIGRYLYEIPAPWVPCKTYEAGGKKRWSEWSDDPWKHVRMPRPAPLARQERPKPVETVPQTQDVLPGRFQALYAELEAAITDAETMDALTATMRTHDDDLHMLPEEMKANLRKTYSFKSQALKAFGEAA